MGGQTGRAIVGIRVVMQVNGPLTNIKGGVFIRCHTLNKGDLFVGFNANITADISPKIGLSTLKNLFTRPVEHYDHTSGIIIEPGRDLLIPTQKLSDLFFTANVKNTKFFWMVQYESIT